MLISYKNANIYQRHGICVLKNVNLQVDEGQFIYLIGRVGSGKTTLMRTLYCELDIDEAEEAMVLGRDLLTIRQKVFFVLCRYLLDWLLNVDSNLMSTLH